MLCFESFPCHPKLTLDPRLVLIYNTIVNMRKIISCLLILALGLSATGCATIVQGTTQKIKVSSEPPDATVQVDGKVAGTTPVKLRLKTHKDYVLTFIKEGYKDEKVTLLRVVGSATCGNIFMWGLVGWAVDGLTASQYRLRPDKVHIEMKKEESNTEGKVSNEGEKDGRIEH